MSDTYHFWIHGVNVQVEDMEASGLHIVRKGTGAHIRQSRGTSNWFHLAIPTPTQMEGHTYLHFDAWLRMSINNDATITKVHVREAGSDDGECSIVYNSGETNITGQTTKLTFDLDDTG